MDTDPELPDVDSDEGAVARLSLAEARGPGSPDYDEAQFQACLRRFKLVLSNRLTHKPSQFKAPGAKNLRDIIKAPGQFEGFESYPILSDGVSKNIQHFMDIANDTTDKRQKRYKDFLSTAVAIAKAPVMVDPSSTGLFGWRTKGHKSPGARFKPFDDLAGITFYTLVPALLSVEEADLAVPDRIDGVLSEVPRMVEEVGRIDGCFPDGVRSLAVRIVTPNGTQIEVHINAPHGPPA